MSKVLLLGSACLSCLLPSCCRLASGSIHHPSCLSFPPCYAHFSSTGNMLVASACERNKQPILTALTPYLLSSSPPLLVEVAAGTGQHMQHIASHFPSLRYLPTDVTQEHLHSIAAYAQTLLHKTDAAVCPPVYLDIAYEWNDQCHNEDFSKTLLGLVSSPPCTTTEIAVVDFILNCNMIHISSNAAVSGLFHNARLLLKPGGALFTYGPYSVGGLIRPDSNVNFDRSLRRQNKEWGYRDIDELKQMAGERGMVLEKVQEMPANNHLIVFRKS
eukprot:GHVS01064167.1.p1 GENE.GHVS01064167.1~~GHVS01064167.1.p1  ORF type:complete len:273 (+),score=43.65 GHVS01064167.1:3-821(+)